MHFSPVANYGPDAPAIIRVCPECGRFIRAPETLQWREIWPEQPSPVGGGIEILTQGHCSQCGEIDLVWEGWGDDYWEYAEEDGDG